MITKEPELRPTGASGDLQARSRRAGRRRSGQGLAAAGFLAPNLVGFLAFTFFPVLFSFWMAFTNWSLKPAVIFHYVGMRNFTDLLGVRPIAQADPALLAEYVFCGLLAVAGMVAALWANMARWNGTRLGGAVLALAGVAFLIIGSRDAIQGVALAGILALLCGLAAAAQEDGDLKPGVGSIPGVMIAAGAAGLWRMHTGMEKTYEPTDTYFWQYFYNTVFMMIGIPFAIGGSLLVALLLHEDLPTGAARQRMVGAAICLLLGVVMGAVIWTMGNPNAGLLCALLWGIVALGIGCNVVAFRTLFYLPAFTSGVALMILWKALYNPTTGPVNLGLGALYHVLGIHADPPHWLSDVNWAKPAIIIMGVWTGIGGTNMLLYLAGLSNLPKELLDAADVDGAGPWHRFRHVIWPQLAPPTFFITIMSIIGGLQGGFEQARVMTSGGPAGSTTTLSYYIYNKAFQDLDMGYASAISWVLFLIVFVATALNWKFGKGLEVD